jgi:hypothetical protein
VRSRVLRPHVQGYFFLDNFLLCSFDRGHSFTMDKEPEASPGTHETVRSCCRPGLCISTL